MSKAKAIIHIMQRMEYASIRKAFTLYNTLSAYGRFTVTENTINTYFD